MRRILLDGGALLSLLLCAATVVLWMRSEGTSDELEYEGARTYGLYSFQRRVFLAVMWDPKWPASPPSGMNIRTHRGWSTGPYCWMMSEQHGSSAGGFGIGRADSLPDHWYGSFRIISFPHWFAAAGLAIAPLIRARHVIRAWKRRKRGLCAICGYDLRATLDRCPECGAQNQRRDESSPQIQKR